MKSIALTESQRKEISTFISVSKDCEKYRIGMYNSFTKNGERLYSTNGRTMFVIPTPSYLSEIDNGAYSLDGAVLSLIEDCHPIDMERVIPRKEFLTYATANVTGSQITSFITLVSNHPVDTDSLHLSDILKIVGKKENEVTVGWNETDSCPVTISFKENNLFVVAMPCRIYIKEEEA